MEKLAPEVNRYRLLIEGYYKRSVFESDIEEFIRTFCRKVDIAAIGDPMIYSPTSHGKNSMEGFEGYQGLKDANLSLYVWEDPKFFSLFIYSCKEFDIDKAIGTTIEYFQSVKFEHKIF